MDKESKDVYCDVNAVMRAFDCSQPYVGRLKEEGIIIQPKRGKYDLVESTRNYVNRLRNKTEKIDSDGNVIDYHTEKARLTKMQADKAEMEVKELSGELVNVTSVVLEWQNILSDVKGKMLSIPSKLATIIVDIDNPAKAQELIEDYVREALQELANYEGKSKRKEDTVGGDVSPPATAKANGKRVGRPRKKA